MEVTGAHGGVLRMQACSTGGGRILVNKLDGVEMSFTGDSTTLIVRNRDDRGHVADVTYALSQAKVNVAGMTFTGTPGAAAPSWSSRRTSRCRSPSWSLSGPCPVFCRSPTTKRRIDP